MMSAEGALLERTQETFSADELRIATAIVYARFRGLFSKVTTERALDRRAEFVVWGAQADGPLFRIGRRNGQFVAIDIDERHGKKISADRLEDLFEALREQYPAISAL
jgi:hypothetical protein